MWIRRLWRRKRDALVIAWARTDGAGLVRRRVVQENVRAQRVYERDGFQLTGRTAVRERDGVIEVEMERALS
jgi:RimJ/RimL family protein N-acetyltransferase